MYRTELHYSGVKAENHSQKRSPLGGGPILHKDSTRLIHIAHKIKILVIMFLGRILYFSKKLSKL